jgi:hypothetical protein
MSHDSERKPTGKANSRTVGHKGGTITTLKGNPRAKGTHSLSSAEEETHHDGERRPTSEGHSRSVESRGKTNLVQQMNVSERRALTNYRA